MGEKKKEEENGRGKYQGNKEKIGRRSWKRGRGKGKKNEERRVVRGQQSRNAYST